MTETCIPPSLDSGEPHLQQGLSAVLVSTSVGGGQICGTECTEPLNNQCSDDVLQSLHEKIQPDAALRSGKKQAARSVPGARASTARATDFWNSVARWILTSRCGRLRSFLFSSFRARADEAQSYRTSRPVWPIPLPYTNRDDGSKFLTTSFQRGVNAVILLLNWLHLGQPGTAPKPFSLRWKLTGEQKGVVLRLERLMQLWVDSPEVSAADMGRTASKVESVEDQIAPPQRFEFGFLQLWERVVFH